MSKESLDYQKLCSNYYSSYGDGCCMESCEFYNHNECPVVYVNGLLEKKDEEIALLEKELDLACECLDEHFWDCCPEIYSSTKEDWLNDFKNKAKEIKNENKS